MWELLLVILLDGREVYVNPREIVTITEAQQADDPGKHYTDRVRCVISMSDGKVTTTAEECEHIEERLHELSVKRLRELRAK